jgi:Uma2 family endonuclease
MEVRDVTRRYGTNPESNPVPDFLLKETFEGINLYYKGYRQVLTREKTLEDIMGCSTLQFVILNYLLHLLHKNLDIDKYIIGTNEAGVHLGYRKNFSNDIAVYDWAVLTPEKISARYADVAPKLVVEVDVDFEVDAAETDISTLDVVHGKIRKMLEFGTERFIWIFSASKKVLIAEAGRSEWTIIDWKTDFELWPGVICNTGAYLEEKNIIV